MNAWEKYKEKVAAAAAAAANASGDVRPWDVLNKSNYTDDETAKSRMDICLSCDRLIKSTRQCKECGCFMHIKTKLSAATCPLSKW